MDTICAQGEGAAVTTQAVAWDDVLSQACRAAEVRAAALVLRESPRTVLEPALVTRHVADHAPWPEGASTVVAVAAQVVPADEILIVADIRRDPRFGGVLMRSTPIRFVARVPLTTREGAPLGALYLLDTAERELSREQILELRSVTGRLVRQVALRREMADIYLSTLRHQDRQAEGITQLSEG